MKRKIFLAAFAAWLAAAPAWAVTPVPAGNRSAEQPAVPGASHKRTAEGKTTFEAKYRKVLALLQSDEDLRRKIAEAAETFGIDPVHIAGAIVGEHTYNVDAYDRLQTYYVKAVSYLQSDLSFAHEGESIEDFVTRPQFAECQGLSGSADLWSCRERVWNEHFRGRTVDGTSFPDNRFSAVFFQPLYAGQTFGIGQLNPLTALMVTDAVHDATGLPKISADDPQEVYRTIMDPDLTLLYVAATLREAIDAYRDIAGFDISQNPGITATLYNLGDPRGRAENLRLDNEALASIGEPPRLPAENYYGWLVNEKLADLQALF